MYRPLQKLRSDLDRARQIVREEGFCTLWFKLWGRICYRRLGLYSQELDGDPVAEVHTQWPLDLGQLAAEDMGDYLTLHRSARLPELQQRWTTGQICFTARLQGRLIYVCWASVSHAWIDYLSRRIELAPDEAYIFESFTSPECRGGNVAPACHAYMHNYLQAKGLHRLFAAVLAENKPAIRAAIKGGYHRVGTLRTLWLHKWRHSWGQVPT